MLLSEISEYIIEKYPQSILSESKDINIGCREDWYEEYLIDILMDYFTYEVIDICGCGNPEDTNEAIRLLLNIRYEWQEDKLEYDDVISRYLTDLHINNDDYIQWGILQYMMYKLNCCDILEHGSSVGGSWLTTLGKLYLIVLNKWHEREVSEN